MKSFPAKNIHSSGHNGKIRLRKVNHKGADRIGLFFDYDQELINWVKAIPGRKYSKTLKCWYLPNSDDSVTYLRKAGLEWVESPTETVKESGDSDSLISQGQDKERKVRGEYIIVKRRDEKWFEAFMPHDKPAWIDAVKQINGRKWDKDQVCWMLPYAKQSLNHLNQSIGRDNLKFEFEIDPDIKSEYVEKDPEAHC